MNFKCIMLSKSQAQKSICYIIPHIWNSRKTQSYHNRKHQCLLEAVGGGEDVRNILYHACRDGYMTIYLSKFIELSY